MLLQMARIHSFYGWFCSVCVCLFCIHSSIDGYLGRFIPWLLYNQLHSVLNTLMKSRAVLLRQGYESSLVPGSTLSTCSPPVIHLVIRSTVLVLLVFTSPLFYLIMVLKYNSGEAGGLDTPGRSCEVLPLGEKCRKNRRVWRAWYCLCSREIPGVQEKGDDGISNCRTARLKLRLSMVSPSSGLPTEMPL